MKRPSRFNPALLSLSTRPIVERILVARSRGLEMDEDEYGDSSDEGGGGRCLTGHQNLQNQPTSGRI